MADGIPWDFPLASSVEGRLLSAVVDRLKTCNLPGIPKDRIIIQSIGWQPDPNEVPPPYIIVSPADEETPWDAGSNERDETIFAVVIAGVLANAREMKRGTGLQLFWRQSIRRKFQNLSSRFTELTMPDNCTLKQTWIQNGRKFLEAAKKDGRDAQYFLLRCRVREPRE